MNRIKRRLLNTYRIFKGPFYKQGKLEIRMETRASQGEMLSQVLPISALSQGVESSSTGFPLKLQISNNQLYLDLPISSILRKATWASWDTIWDGSQAVLKGGESGGCFRLAIPAQGWWNLNILNASIDLMCQNTLEQESESWVKDLKNTIREIIFGKDLRNWVAAGGLHALLFLTLLNLDSIKSRVLSALVPYDISTQTITETVPTQVPVQVMKSDRDFNGRGLFATIQRNAERNFKAEDVAESLKNLKKLVVSAPLPMAQKKGGQDLKTAPNLANSLKSLQSNISQQRLSDSGKSHGEGALQVHWKSRFSSEPGKSSNTSPNEDQLRILQGVFAQFQDKYRGCYETALLKFDEMAVTVSFEAEINREGQIGRTTFTVSGRSTPDSQEVLLSCLKNVMGQVKVDKKLSGIRVKNQFIFKS